MCGGSEEKNIAERGMVSSCARRLEKRVEMIIVKKAEWIVKVC